MAKIWILPAFALLRLADGTEQISGMFFNGTFLSEPGREYLQLLDIARRMFTPGDTEFMTLAGAYDPIAQGITEGAQWGGAFWTQNSYGFAFAAQPFLQEPFRTWLGNSFLWWFDHMADGGQVAGGIPGVPDGILCDNGSPSGCNYKQCGPSRSAKLVPRKDSKRSESQKLWKSMFKTEDTPGVGHDWVIEGTLAGVIMQAEALLVSRNITGIKHFLPMFLRTSNFMESRRVQDSIPGGLNTKGLFYAGNGANLLAPSYGGFLLPAGCIVNATFSNCSNRAFAYLSALTVTYSAMLDRMIALEDLAYPEGGHRCTTPYPGNPGPSECKDLFKARRALNEETIASLLTRHDESRGGTLYFTRSIDPDGTKHGVLGQERHSYFESAPNHDAIALYVVNDSLAAEVYKSIKAVPELSPCAFTAPNWPDYDDSCGGCLGYGTWVSGGSWSTAEARMILAHYRLGQTDSAAASMKWLVYPYAELFKLDNPIRDFGCGPGMYSLHDHPNNDIVLDVDIFGIPAAFIRGLFEYQYSANALVLRPHLPSGVSYLSQKFPILWGNLSLFLSLSASNATAVIVDGKSCNNCILESSVKIDWALLESSNKSEIMVELAIKTKDSSGISSWTRPGQSPNDQLLTRMHQQSSSSLPAQCAPSKEMAASAANASQFVASMQKAGLAMRMETAHAQAFLMSLNTTVERCVGRLTGAIKGIPPQPPQWKKYNMSTNQTAADQYFAAATGKVKAGLFNLLSTYAQSANPLLQKIYNLWLGRDASTHLRTQNLEGIHALDKEIEAAEEYLATLRAKKQRMFTSSRGDALPSAISIFSSRQPTFV